MAVLVGCIVRSWAMCINRGVESANQAWRPKPTVDEPNPANIGQRRRPNPGGSSPVNEARNFPTSVPISLPLETVCSRDLRQFPRPTLPLGCEAPPAEIRGFAGQNKNRSALNRFERIAPI